MEMEHRLPGCAAVRLIKGKPFRGKGRLHGTRHLRGSAEKCRGLRLIQGVDVFGVSLRRNKDMAWIDLTKIHEGHCGLVFVHDRCRNLLGRDPAEYAVRHPSSPAS